MTVTVNGTTGVSLVQDGVVVQADLAANVAGNGPVFNVIASTGAIPASRTRITWASSTVLVGARSIVSSLFVLRLVKFASISTYERAEPLPALVTIVVIVGQSPKYILLVHTQYHNIEDKQHW